MLAAKQAFLFDDLGPRKVQADFSGGTLSSDAGALLLRQVDANLGLCAELAHCFYDQRNPVWVDHSVDEMLRQRLHEFKRHMAKKLEQVPLTPTLSPEPLAVESTPPGSARGRGQGEGDRRD